ncbi:hypothetical protein OIU34_21905 [Pararhizobium sp. BT-229]|uniref:hypothetical protein n=1 Tax=Pararhizobium sp. BT-229 TaxID=2986923 RepID=UPI0021F7AEF9|nr:hypothetical protein [Pararhizobium sp. BT-229]MCV9964548.1 hypothetical protein [Pararhizobium sp. BT-229]
MDPSTTYQSMLVDSDLIAHSFALRSPSFSADEAADLVGWLASEFTLGRCSWFASAIAHVRGREHHISFTHADGRLAHAVASVSPQFNASALRGDGCDILGRRPLGTILSEMDALNRHIQVEIGSTASRSDFEAGEIEAMIDLATELPWCSRLVGKPPSSPDGPRLKSIALRLGMPEH